MVGKVEALEAEGEGGDLEKNGGGVVGERGEGEVGELGETAEEGGEEGRRGIGDSEGMLVAIGDGEVVFGDEREIRGGDNHRRCGR